MKKVAVFGSFVVDLMARSPHLPVPGETVKGSMFKMGPGGKGFNQCVAAHKAGADVVMMTKVGSRAAEQASFAPCIRACHRLPTDGRKVRPSYTVCMCLRKCRRVLPQCFPLHHPPHTVGKG